MKIFHLMGPSCSGKSHIVNLVNKKYKVPTFDVKQIHIDTGSIVNGIFDWNKFRENRKKKVVITMLQEFLITYRNEKFLFIESSGTNQEINTILEKVEWAEQILLPLQPAPKSKREQFARQNNTPLDVVEESSERFWKTIDYDIGFSYTQKEILEELKKHIA
jgi:shikimate kinase